MQGRVQMIAVKKKIFRNPKKIAGFSCNQEQKCDILMVADPFRKTKVVQKLPPQEKGTEGPAGYGPEVIRIAFVKRSCGHRDGFPAAKRRIGMKIPEAEDVVLSGAKLLRHSTVNSPGTPDIICVQKGHIGPGGGLQTAVSGMGSTMIFCPLAVAEEVFLGLAADREIDAISARVTDNRKLEDFRKIAGYWFAEPNPTGAKTEWNFAGYKYYPYALDIDDSLLRAAENSLENSLFINGLCTWLIFGLSAGAGFFISFLMIRQRKREIALMRTLGTGQGSIFLGLLTEQLLLVVLGIGIGGLWFRWQPAQRLLGFGFVYLLGLLCALAVFLRNNLILAIKEE